MRSFQEYLERMEEEYGESFDDSGLPAKLIPYWESGETVRVQVGERIFTGTIDTRWLFGLHQPVFVLLVRTPGQTSDRILSNADNFKVLAVKRGRKYEKVEERTA